MLQRSPDKTCNHIKFEHKLFSFQKVTTTFFYRVWSISSETDPFPPLGGGGGGSCDAPLNSNKPQIHSCPGPLVEEQWFGPAVTANKFLQVGSRQKNRLRKALSNYRNLIIRFVIPVVFIIKPDWSVCICLTQLYDGRDMYRMYYTKNNYMFRPFILAIFISQPEDGQCRWPKHVVVLYVINSLHISTIIYLC